MFASRKLDELAERKLQLHARITVRRMECVVAVSDLAQPIALVDRAWALWRQVSPLAKAVGIPLGLFFFKRLFARRKRIKAPPRRGRFMALLGMLPMLFRVVQGFRAAAAMGKSSATSPGR